MKEQATTEAYHDFQTYVKDFLLHCKLRNLTQTTIDWYKFYLISIEHFLEHTGLQFADLIPSDLRIRMMKYLIDNQFASHTMRGRRPCPPISSWP
ncbi:hypothetical protein GCM10008018_16540 [Paenibacillus marchantiophytorum]|uniref:Core-binding (CB) domain-containing protein n=1 Tax=Paenibacillus marchantiophytorum TaxID=1619310 RepID=A0ABQ2BS73_9BACL|nr:hypothetical protein [Paenibacillus marchantiophytorum]GGI46327.1 hypothetical protein GCM10008018_16540 [Paenibacillus marchantiophytorum]